MNTLEQAIQSQKAVTSKGSSYDDYSVDFSATDDRITIVCNKVSQITQKQANPNGNKTLNVYSKIAQGFKFSGNFILNAK